MKSIGIIDIGTNTILGLKAIIDRPNVQIISDQRFHYRAGKRLDDAGNISLAYKSGMRDAVKAALVSLGDCAIIKIVATEVLRKPKDGAQFAEELSSEIGYLIDIIEPQREAELNFKGVVFDLPDSGNPLAIIDVGGGSTELALGMNKKFVGWSSIQLGAVFMAELIGYEKPTGDYLKAATQFFDNSDFYKIIKPGIERVAAVGGSAVALTGILMGLKEFEPEKIQGFNFEQEAISLILDKLASLSLEERKKLMTFDPQRADIIIGGGAIILAFMRRFNIGHIEVSTRGLRHGILCEYL
jgi:exopolyphosphatase/guanosine-5'-triphosphate,3'-diphosphate pyrophosphatase